jgi:hypothetical protein
LALEDVDAERYPRLAAYLALLPDGLRSYPECTSRGTLVSSATQGHELASFPDGLPTIVRQLIASPPLPGAWVSAVHSDAVFFAVCDTHYPSEAAMLTWTTERTLRTAQSRMYRALTRIAGPNMLLRMASTAHGMFQRGTDMTARAIIGGMQMKLEHPPHLHGGYNHLANVAMIEAVLSLAGVPRAQVEMSESTPTYAIYRARWG